MDINLVITLLTVTVIILSVVIVAMLVVMTLVLVKIQRIVRSVDEITHNVAVSVDTVTRNVVSASEWLSPVTLITHIAKLFRK